MSQPPRAKILLVEDDQGDILLTQEAFENAKLRVDLEVIEDGESALKRLRGEPPYEGKEAPDLVLLDLNLPKISGREILAEVKSSPGLKRIPIVVLTTSQAEADVVKSYDLGVNCYITKPVDFDQFRRIVMRLEEFWFTIVKLPGR